MREGRGVGGRKGEEGKGMEGLVRGREEEGQGRGGGGGG